MPQPPRAPDKPRLNVGAIGHVHHGKTTLAAAITQVLAAKGLAEPRTPESLLRTWESRLRGITINPPVIEYETARRRYSHVDCPGHASYLRNALVALYGL